MKIACQKVSQNNVEFFLAKIKFSDLKKIATINHRIIMGFDDNDLPIYNNSFQRKVNPARQIAIKDYLLTDEEATFPNSIILSVPYVVIRDEIVDNVFTEIDIDESKIELEGENPIYIQIIDGQHRFAGMKLAYDELVLLNNQDRLSRLLDFEFVVSIYVDARIEFQAMLFSTINRTPVKVPYDIVYDLFGLVEKDSPQKTALAICLELNSTRANNRKNMSPFAKRIKLLGKKNKGEDSVISQQIFIKTLILLICPSIQIAEIERFKDRGYFFTGGTYKTIFREFYANSKDNQIFMTLENFFIAVERTFVDKDGNSLWRINESNDNPLQRTIGFLALIDVLIELFHKGLSERRLTIEFFEENLSKAKDIEFIDDSGNSKYPYTSKGKGQLSSDLRNLIAN